MAHRWIKVYLPDGIQPDEYALAFNRVWIVLPDGSSVEPDEFADYELIDDEWFSAPRLHPKRGRSSR